MTRTRVLAALLAGLILAGVGTAAVALGADDPAAATAPMTVVAQTRTTTSSSTPTPTPAADVPAATSADEATFRAVEYLGGGTVSKIERETEHGRPVWEVEVRHDARVTEIHVDTATGAITRVKDDGRNRDDRGRRGDDDRSSRHGSDDGPGHDRLDDKGGDR